MPDTIVFDKEEAKPTWYYTNQDGYLMRNKDFEFHDITKFFCVERKVNVRTYKGAIGAMKDVTLPCAVMKTAAGGCKGNSVKLLYAHNY